MDVQAAIFGAGCFATPNLACSVSGAGEPIMRAALARTIVSAIADEGEDGDVHAVLEHSLTRFGGQRDGNAGVLLLAQGRLWCAFTTESMALAWASSAHPKPKAKILRRPASSDSRAGTTVYITSFSLHDTGD